MGAGVGEGGSAIIGVGIGARVGEGVTVGTGVTVGAGEGVGETGTGVLGCASPPHAAAIPSMARVKAHSRIVDFDLNRSSCSLEVSGL